MRRFAHAPQSEFRNSGFQAREALRRREGGQSAALSGIGERRRLSAAFAHGKWPAACKISSAEKYSRFDAPAKERRIVLNVSTTSAVAAATPVRTSVHSIEPIASDKPST
jgi:hypothetical protein